WTAKPLGPVADDPLRTGAVDRADRAADAVVEPGEIDLLDLVTECRKDEQRVVERCDRIGVTERAVGHVARVREPEPSWLATHFVGGGAFRYRRGIRVPERRPGGRIEQCGAVAHGPSQRVVDRPAVEGIAVHRSEGDAA